MRTSETIGELAAALAEFHKVAKNPTKNKTVKVKSMSGGAYEFSYATFDSILELVRGPLAENGLVLIQSPSQGGEGTATELVTRLQHSSGEWMEDNTIVPRGPGEGPQALGSSLAYIKRYAACAMLMLAGEDDDDGNIAEGNSVTEKTSRFQKAPAKDPAAADFGAAAEALKEKSNNGAPDEDLMLLAKKMMAWITAKCDDAQKTQARRICEELELNMNQAETVTREKLDALGERLKEVMS